MKSFKLLSVPPRGVKPEERLTLVASAANHGEGVCIFKGRCFNCARPLYQIPHEFESSSRVMLGVHVYDGYDSTQGLPEGCPEILACFECKSHRYVYERAMQKGRDWQAQQAAS